MSPHVSRQGACRQLPRQTAKPGEYLLIIGAAVATVAITFTGYASVPDPIASHWGFSGDPNGFMPRAFEATLIALLIAATATLVWQAGRADRAAARFMVALANGLAVFFAVLRYITYDANRDAEVWTNAAPITVGDLLVPAGAGLLAAVMGFAAARHRPDHVVQIRQVTATAAAQAPPTFDAYVAARIMTALPALGAAFAAAGLMLIPAPDGIWIAAVFGVTAVLVALFTRAWIHVDRAGVRVCFGPFGWPRVVRSFDDIVAVGVIDVEPMTYGGWGYRMVPGVRAVVLRRGEGVRLTCRGKPDLVITVDGADEAAAMIARGLTRH